MRKSLLASKLILLSKESSADGEVKVAVCLAALAKACCDDSELDILYKISESLSRKEFHNILKEVGKELHEYMMKVYG